MKKNILIISFLIIFALGTGLYIAIFRPQTTITQNQLVADFTDDRVLVGASHNVFVAKVIERKETKDIGIGPETQFEVEIIDNIKGELREKIIVNQAGGESNKVLGSTYEIPLIEVGKTYILATRYNPQENWYTIIAHENAIISLDVDSFSDSAELKKMVENNQRLSELREAYQNEVLLEADIKHNNTRNSYNSVQ